MIGKIDNVTFSHHMATINGIQLHYVIGAQGDPRNDKRLVKRNSGASSHSR